MAPGMLLWVFLLISILGWSAGYDLPRSTTEVTLEGLYEGVECKNGTSKYKYCGDEDAEGPHCKDCLMFLWTRDGCNNESESGPAKNSVSVEFWQKENVRKVEENIKIFTGIPHLCHGPNETPPIVDTSTNPATLDYLSLPVTGSAASATYRSSFQSTSGKAAHDVSTRYHAGWTTGSSNGGLVDRTTRSSKGDPPNRTTGSTTDDTTDRTTRSSTGYPADMDQAHRTIGLTTVDSDDRTIGLTKVDPDDRTIGLTTVDPDDWTIGLTTVDPDDRTIGLTTVDPDDRTIGLTTVDPTHATGTHSFTIQTPVRSDPEAITDEFTTDTSTLDYTPAVETSEPSSRILIPKPETSTVSSESTVPVTSNDVAVKTLASSMSSHVIVTSSIPNRGASEGPHFSVTSDILHKGSSEGPHFSVTSDIPIEGPSGGSHAGVTSAEHFAENGKTQNDQREEQSVGRGNVDDPSVHRGFPETAEQRQQAMSTKTILLVCSLVFLVLVILALGIFLYRVWVKRRASSVYNLKRGAPLESKSNGRGPPSKLQVTWEDTENEAEKNEENCSESELIPIDQLDIYSV